jgi:hypothetical protein
VLVKLARRVLRRLERHYLRLRRRRLAERTPTVVTRSGDRWYLAVTAPVQPAAALVRAQLELVLEVCAATDIEAVVLPSTDPRRTRIAVPRSRRAELLAGLRRRWSGSVLYVGASWHQPVLLDDARSAPLLAAPRWTVCRPRATAAGSPLHLVDEGCDVVFSYEDAGDLVLGLDNRVAERVPLELVAPDQIEVLGEPYPSLAPLVLDDHAGTIDFPIDVVYTWVDGTDPDWRRSRDDHLARVGALNRQAANASRYVDREELRYALRSLWLYAEWVRHVWIVTAGHRPTWLVDAPSVTLVDHREIFADHSVLPTFNSHAIESQLHRIPGLAEHFLYCNDDVFFGRRVPPERFFEANGTPRFFPSRHTLELGAVTVDDPPVMSAAKNGRELLRRRFGRTVTQKLKHTPHAMRRSLLEELADTFPEDHARTAGSRFRHPEDLSFVSSLAHHYNYLTGRAVPGELDYLYLDLVDAGLPTILARLLRERSLEVFCLNDTDGPSDVLELRGQLVTRFLDRYFPTPSPFERPARRATRAG